MKQWFSTSVGAARGLGLAAVVFGLATQAAAIDRSSVAPLPEAAGSVEARTLSSDRSPSEPVANATPGGHDGALASRHPQLIALEQALAELRLQQPVAPASVPDGKYRLGVSDRGVAALRARLDVPLADGAVPQRFTPELAAAVRRYQRQHGLAPDGIAGRTTIAHLNTPLDARRAQLQLNIDRWRAREIDPQANHIVVNIPEFKLRMYSGGAPVLEMPVVVGERKHATPELSGRMRYVEFHPYWNVPPKIFKRKILPKVRRDERYLARNGYELLKGRSPINPAEVDWLAGERFDFRVRQRPGAGNALGSVKFIFPNPRAIYLHDSPAKAQFAHTRRTYSSGCVRVSDPEALAQEVLRLQNGLQADEVSARFSAGRTSRVDLDVPLPVYLVYQTAWVDAGSDGAAVRYLEDVYQRDDLTPYREQSEPVLVASADVSGEGRAAKAAATLSERATAGGAGQ